jgi:hypothetical protein
MTGMAFLFDEGDIADMTMRYFPTPEAPWHSFPFIAASSFLCKFTR